MNESRHTNVMLEDIRNQMQVVLEIVADTRKQLRHVATDTNRDLHLLERRVTKLENAI
jgi:hypothetical protein